MITTILPIAGSVLILAGIIWYVLSLRSTPAPETASAEGLHAAVAAVAVLRRVLTPEQEVALDALLGPVWEGLKQLPEEGE